MKIEFGNQYIAKYSYITCNKVKVTEEVVVKVLFLEGIFLNGGVLKALNSGENYYFEDVKVCDNEVKVRGIFPGSSLEEEVCYTLHSV